MKNVWILWQGSVLCPFVNGTCPLTAITVLVQVHKMSHLTLILQSSIQFFTFALFISLHLFQSAVIPPSGPITQEEEEAQCAVDFLWLPQKSQLYLLQSGLGVSMQKNQNWRRSNLALSCVKLGPLGIYRRIDLLIMTAVKRIYSRCRVLHA